LKIIISEKLFNIISLTSKNSNIEVGFILLGSKQDDIFIEKIVEMRNLNNSSNSFKLDQKEVDKTYQYSLNNNLEIIGFFHSHPTSTAAPSSRDIESMKVSDKIWFIYSGLNDNMFAFTYKDKLESIEIVTIYT